MWAKIFAHIFNEFLFYAVFMQTNKADIPLNTEERIVNKFIWKMWSKILY